MQKEAEADGRQLCSFQVGAESVLDSSGHRQRKFSPVWTCSSPPSTLGFQQTHLQGQKLKAPPLFPCVTYAK